MTGDSQQPKEERKPRDRLRSEWKAESTWRRHEIASRLNALDKKIGREKMASILDKIEKMIDEQSLPIKVTKSLEASVKVEREKPKEDKKE